MFRPRFIPCLLISQRQLVKTTRFKDPRYLGDPINAVRVFNDKCVDELIILDIGATARAKGPDFEFIAQMAGEAFVPFCYGGGIRSAAEARQLVRSGVEKVAVNTAAMRRPELVREIAAEIGSQSVVASIDVGRGLLRGRAVVTAGARERVAGDPVERAKALEEQGAGEIMLTSVDREGTGAGYDLDLVARASRELKVPLVANGGAGSLDDMALAVTRGGAAAAAAGSLFVFRGRQRGILINYPPEAQIDEALRRARAAPPP